MSDQPDEWWNNPGAASPAPPPPAGPTPQAAPPATPQPNPAPQVDSDSTVVVPARHPGAPPAQYAPQGPPPGSPPPQYGGQPPQYGGQPHQQYAGAQHQGAPPYGGPQFVQHAGPTSRYRAPFGSITMLVGAAVAIVGTFLPWIAFGNNSVNGYETYVIGDNFDSVAWTNPGAYVVAAMVLVMISAVLVLTAGRRVVTWLIALLATGLGGLTAFAAFGAVQSVLDNLFDSDDLGVGFGVILCLVGAVVAGIGAIVVAAKSS